MMKVLKFTIAVCLCLMMVACNRQFKPFKDYANGVVGFPIEKYIEMIERTKNHPVSSALQRNWTEQTYYLENGNKVYVYPEGPRCIVHWEVNKEGIIVGYHGYHTKKGKGKCD